MDRYFTTQAGALKRLMNLQRAASDGSLPRLEVIGKCKDGAEIEGISRALTALRTGRLACYVQSGLAEEQIVFIS